MAGWEGQPARIVYALAMAVLLYLVRDLPGLAVLVLAAGWWLLALLLVAGYPAGSRFWHPVWVRSAMGVAVLVPAWVGLVHLRSGTVSLGEMDNNLLLILYNFCIVWAADIGAYFAGRRFGRRKLAPRVSPGKSWAGVYGGLGSVLLLALLVASWAQCTPAQTFGLVVISLVTAVVSVLGDLLESMLKRHCGLKDSSQLLPGHGGIMDRIDSLTAAIPVFALCMTLAGWLG
jgi:phosphatidate cytidylyltransferase